MNLITKSTLIPTLFVLCTSMVLAQTGAGDPDTFYTGAGRAVHGPDQRNNIL